MSMRLMMAAGYCERVTLATDVRGGAGYTARMMLSVRAGFVVVAVLSCGCGLPEGIWDDTAHPNDGGEGEGDVDVAEGEGEGEGEGDVGVLAPCCDVDDLIVDVSVADETYGRASFAY